MTRSALPLHVADAVATKPSWGAGVLSAITGITTILARKGPSPPTPHQLMQEEKLRAQLREVQQEQEEMRVRNQEMAGANAQLRARIFEQRCASVEVATAPPAPGYDAYDSRPLPTMPAAAHQEDSEHASRTADGEFVFEYDGRQFWRAQRKCLFPHSGWESGVLHLHQTNVSFTADGAAGSREMAYDHMVVRPAEDMEDTGFEPAISTDVDLYIPGRTIQTLRFPDEEVLTSWVCALTAVLESKCTAMDNESATELTAARRSRGH